MARVNTAPVEQARSIFAELGYTVSGDGYEFRAEREWKEVRVTAVSSTTDTPTSGTLRCFVTWEDDEPRLREQLRRADPEYEWAIISVADDGEYEVARAPPGPSAAV